MDKEDYELVPAKRIEYLEKEVEKLRKGMPLLVEKDASTLLEAMNKLTKTIINLTNILQSASDEIVKDYYEKGKTHYLQRIEDQNEKIARGIISMSKMIKQSNTTYPPASETVMNSQPSPTQPPIRVMPDTKIKENFPPISPSKTIPSPDTIVKKQEINDEDIPPPPPGI